MDQDIAEILDRASQLCDDESDSDAEAIIQDALHKYPGDLDLLTMLGKIQSRLHKEHDAEVTFRIVLEKNPVHEDAICALGRLLDQSLRTNEAESAYRNLLTAAPDSHCALDDLCRLLLTEGRHDEALDIARRHVTTYPNHLDAYDGLRYVLAIIEDELCGGYINESLSGEIIQKLVENLLEQYDTLLGIEENVTPISNLPEDVASDMQNEYLRIVGELEHLSRIIDDGDIAVPFSLRNKLSASLKEGLSRRGEV